MVNTVDLCHDIPYGARVDTLLPSHHLDTFARDALPPADLWPEILPGITAGYPDLLNASEALLDGALAAHGPDRPCVHAEDAVWTYGELHSITTRIARVLVDAGVQPGNRVLLRSPNGAWLMATWLAVLRVGGIAVTTMPLLRKPELDPIIAIAQVQFAVVDHRSLEAWMGVEFTGTTIISGGEGESTLQSRVADAEPLLEPTSTSKHDVALIAFTSGTTGGPKATLHFHGDVLAIADTFSANLVRPTPGDVFAGSAPVAFTFGLGASFVFPLRAGAQTVLLERATPAGLAETVGRLGVTVLFTAPTAYRAILASLDDFDLTSLRRCVSAGEMLPASTWRQWHDATGIRLIDGIGATEMLHIFISAADEDSQPGYTGRAVPGYEAAVLDEHLLPLPPGVPGRLAVKGPTGCRYLRGDRQSTYVQGGWNITGDVYEMDADGRFRYLARADDMIISSGYNIAAPEVETALLEHPRVVEAAVIGVPDPDRGAIVKAHLVIAGGAPSDEAEARALTRELQDHVKATIAPYKYPREIAFVEALPKTATGKLQRKQLKEGP